MYRITYVYRGLQGLLRVEGLKTSPSIWGDRGTSGSTLITWVPDYCKTPEGTLEYCPKTAKRVINLLVNY